jgi:glycosyltransferase involved in cell wall biosynthesis
LYATWKSDLGDRVADLLHDRTDVTFDPIRGECGWPELRRRYHAADLFICSPGPEEGFYLPGLEAMAAGCGVVSSFVGGNASYMVDGQNMLGATYDDAASHANSLVTLVENSELRNALIDGGANAVVHHRLQREAAEFADFLSTLHQLDETGALASQRGADR